MTVMIVEDNELMRGLLRILIKDVATTISEVSDGSLALAAYAEHRPDWVLMDIRMEVMDGIEATRQIKSAYPNANIMIVTDYDDVSLREAAREAGACGYVVKENLLALRELLAT